MRGNQVFRPRIEPVLAQAHLGELDRMLITALDCARDQILRILTGCGEGILRGPQTINREQRGRSLPSIA